MKIEGDVRREAVLVDSREEVESEPSIVIEAEHIDDLRRNGFTRSPSTSVSEVINQHRSAVSVSGQIEKLTETINKVYDTDLSPVEVLERYRPEGGTRFSASSRQSGEVSLEDLEVLKEASDPDNWIVYDRKTQYDLVQLAAYVDSLTEVNDRGELKWSSLGRRLDSNNDGKIAEQEILADGERWREQQKGKLTGLGIIGGFLVHPALLSHGPRRQLVEIAFGVFDSVEDSIQGAQSYKLNRFAERGKVQI